MDGHNQRRVCKKAIEDCNTAFVNYYKLNKKTIDDICKYNGETEVRVSPLYSFLLNHCGLKRDYTLSITFFQDEVKCYTIEITHGKSKNQLTYITDHFMCSDYVDNCTAYANIVSALATNLVGVTLEQLIASTK